MKSGFNIPPLFTKTAHEAKWEKQVDQSLFGSTSECAPNRLLGNVVRCDGRFVGCNKTHLVSRLPSVDAMVPRLFCK